MRVHEICIREDAPLAHLNGICDIMDSQADTLAVLRDLRRFHERLSFLFPGECSMIKKVEMDNEIDGLWGE